MKKRLTLLLTLTVVACGGGSTGPLLGDPPAVAGTYDVTGQSTNALGSQFTFAGQLILTQAGDPPGETLGGTLTLSYSRREFSTTTVSITDASVDASGNLRFVAAPSAGLSIWTALFKDTGIVDGRFGCDGCYSGTWQATRR